MNDSGYLQPVEDRKTHNKKGRREQSEILLQIKPYEELHMLTEHFTQQKKC